MAAPERTPPLFPWAACVATHDVLDRAEAVEAAAVTEREFAGEGELGVDGYVRHLTREGEQPEMGPEIFSAQLRALDPAAAGRLCADRTRAFLAATAGSPAALDRQ